jgi:uncharacterized membrane protein YtjA (UPF0391 family)
MRQRWNKATSIRDSLLRGAPRPQWMVGKGLGMARWLVALLAIGVLAAVSGFTGLALGAPALAKVLFSVFLVIFLAVLVVSSVSENGRETAP